MALFRRFFYRKPPEGLWDISERVFVFECCFTANLLEGNEYQACIRCIVDQLRECFPDASFMVFNFGDGDHQSQITNVLSEYSMTVINYPRQYGNCSLLALETIHHFLKSSENWLSSGQRNVILMHCQNGALPILAFMLTTFLIYRKQYTGEQKTFDVIYKQAPQELLHLLCPLNPVPSQLRYLQYVSRMDLSSECPPSDRALMLDCVILRVTPNMDGEWGCRPIFRIYGSDPFMAADRTAKMLSSMPKNSKAVGYFRQADCELIKVDINCHVQGDVVLECVTLDDNLEHEEMMFRSMFNTTFIRSNALMLNRDEIDILWNVKGQFPKDFRVEVFFSKMDSSSSLVGLDLHGIQDKVQDIFSYQEKLDITSFPTARRENGQNVFSQSVKDEQLEHVFRQNDIEIRTKSGCTQVNDVKSKIYSPQTVQKDVFSVVSLNGVKEGGFLDTSPAIVVESPISKASENDPISSPIAAGSETLLASSKSSLDLDYTSKMFESARLQVSVQRPAQSKIISRGISQSALTNPPSYSSPLQASPVALSRYRSATSVLGITALLHDHAEFSKTEVRCPLTPESSISPDPCLLKPVQSTDLSVSPPLEQHTSGKHSINSKSGSKASAPPAHPPPPPPPPPSPLLLSTRSLTPQLRQPSPPLPSAVPPPPPPPPLQPSTVLSSPLPPPFPPPPPFSLTREVGPSFRNQSSAPSSLSTTPHPSSATAALPSTPNTLSAPPPPPPPLIGRAKPSSTSSVPLAPPPPSPSLAKTVSSSLRIPSSGTPPLPSSPPCSQTSGLPSLKDTSLTSAVPPPPPPPSSNVSIVKNPSVTIHSLLTTLPAASSTICQDSSPLPVKRLTSPATPPPPPLPQCSGSARVSAGVCSPLPQPCPPSSMQKEAPVRSCQVVPPPPAPLLNGLSKDGTASLQLHSSVIAPVGAKGKLQSRMSTRIQGQSRKTPLKPYHWLKLTRAMQGSLWAEAQKPEEASKAPELDMSELESLFSATAPNSDHGGTNRKTNGRGSGLKPNKVHLIELRRAYNCEIMLTKVKNSVLALDGSALDTDQVDNLIKFCPTKEEIELLKNYNGDKENLGKCEQFFLELMKVPRVESKLRVFSFKIQFFSQVSDLRYSLNIVNSASEEVRSSVKLKRIMQTVLSLGNALNHGTARGSAVGFRLDSLLKLTETRACNNKLTLMHYLCKVLAEKLPEVLDFQEDLLSLEAATKIQLKYLAEEMQAISKGLEKVLQELTASENDGPVSQHFRKTLKEFLGSAEVDVRSLASLYSGVGRNADALALYFGEDPARCPFEQVVSTLLNFVRMFQRAHNENCKQLEFEKKKKAQKEEENVKAKLNAPRKELENENVIASGSQGF